MRLLSKLALSGLVLSGFMSTQAFAYLPPASQFTIDAVDAVLLPAQCNGRFSLIEGGLGRYAQSLGLTQDFAGTVTQNVVYVVTDGAQGTMPGKQVRSDINWQINNALMSWKFEGVGKAGWCDQRGGILASMGILREDGRSPGDISVDEGLDKIRQTAPIKVSSSMTLNKLYRSGKTVNLTYYDAGTKDQWSPNLVSDLKTWASKSTCSDKSYGAMIQGGYNFIINFFDKNGSGFAMVKLDKTACLSATP